jgi:hypothetical protein
VASIPQSGPPRTVPYLGATEDELRRASNAKRALALADQRSLFPHHGLLELLPDTIVLGDWRSVPRSEVADVQFTFTDAYSRWVAAGARGNYPSFGVFGSLGKPLIVGILDDEPVYLLLEFRWLSGINQNRTWYPILVDWLNPLAGS